MTPMGPGFLMFFMEEQAKGVPPFMVDAAMKKRRRRLRKERREQAQLKASLEAERIQQEITQFKQELLQTEKVALKPDDESFDIYIGTLKAMIAALDVQLKQNYELLRNIAKTDKKRRIKQQNKQLLMLLYG